MLKKLSTTSEVGYPQIPNKLPPTYDETMTGAAGNLYHYFKLSVHVYSRLFHISVPDFSA